MTARFLSIEGGALAIPEPDANGVRAYKGVPYAAPPVGRLRWRPPQPVPPWAGVRPVGAFGPNSLQGVVFDDIDPRPAGISEDCLYLNIWTPAAPDDGARAPTMVWIHGGGFVVGSGAEPRYDGARLAARGILVVTLNHRLNALGFLAHPELTAESEHRASGNYGMLDLVAALRWVKRNIAAFGGDPDKVTIAGESAGSEAASALMASPLAKGLFARVIGESGAMFASPSPRARAAGEGRGRRPRIHAQGRSENAGRTARRRRRGHPRRRAGARLPSDRRRMVSSAFARRDLRAPASRATRRSWPAGTRMKASISRCCRTRRSGPIPIWCAHCLATGLRRRCGFIREDRLTATRPRRARSAATSRSSIPPGRGSRPRSKAGRADIFRFRFDHAPLTPQGWFGEGSSRDAGAFHASELSYVFDNLHACPWLIDDADRALARLASSYWINFVKTGDPNGPGLPRWPSYRSAGAPVMALAEPASAGPEEWRERHIFLQEAVSARQRAAELPSPLRD